MHKGNLAYKAITICMVLFCVYMQWSPVADLDYVWINGHEHYVGASNPHQMGKVVTPTALTFVSPHPEDSAPHLLSPPVVRSTDRTIPATTLRL